MNKLSNNYIKLIKDLCVCPSCKSELLVKKDNIKCKKCQKKFSIIKGIPILIDSKISNSTHNMYKNFKIDKALYKNGKFDVFNYINKIESDFDSIKIENKQTKGLFRSQQIHRTSGPTACEIVGNLVRAPNSLSSIT